VSDQGQHRLPIMDHKKTVTASSNEILCFLRFFLAFSLIPFELHTLFYREDPAARPQGVSFIIIDGFGKMGGIIRVISIGMIIIMTIGSKSKR
jgi:hypothetical protein